MQPIKSNITSTGKCLNPVTTKCVVWDGPDITCLDGTTLCKGQNVETTLYTLATKLCDIYTALSLEDINTCINNINDGSSVSIGPTSSIQEVFSAIIKKVCTLDGRVQNLEDTPCLEQTAVVPECLRVKAVVYPSYNSVNFTLPLQYYAELVANSVCGLLIDIQLLQTNADTINQQIDDLWTALQACSTTSQNYVLPTCTYNWSINPDGDPVTVQTAFTWLEADYCTLRGLLGSNTALTSAVNSQCANLGAENTLAPGLGGTMSSLPSWVDNPINISDAVTNMWLTVCDMRSYISDVLSLCCKSMCDYLQVGFVPIWNPEGTKVLISFVEPTNPVIYEDGAVPPASSSPFVANGTAFPLPVQAWLLAQFPTTSQTNIQFLLDDGNGNAFTLNTNKTINQWAVIASAGQYLVDFTAAGVPVNYDQTSVNQTINISFTYDVIINSITKTCTFDATLGLPYICNAPKPYNCNGEIVVVSNSGTDMQVKVTALQEETPIVQAAPVTGAGSGLDTLEDTVTTFGLGLPGFIVTVTDPAGNTQCRHIIARPSATEIQVDSNWTTPIDNTWTYEIKDYYYSYATVPPWQGPTTYIQNALTGFDVYIVLSNSTFDINDQNTWQIMAQANNVSPVVMCQGTGYIWGDDTFQGNTEYIVIVQALYKCGASEFVSATTYNQIAASVSLQVGTPPNLLFGVFDASQTYVRVEQVLSDNTSLPNKYAQIGIPAKYALDLPTGTNTTQLGITPLPAVWQLATLGQAGTFSQCGMCTDPAGSTASGSNTIPNHDFVIGTYTGYSVELFQLDQYGTAYIPLFDSNGLAYKTDSTLDPTLQFINNTPSGTPVLYNVPATYPYTKLPLIVRYDPSNFKVNNSPDFHRIKALPFTFTLNAVNDRAGQTVQWFAFTATARIDILKWDSGTNTYVPYSGGGRYMEFIVNISAGSGTGTTTVTSPATPNTNTMPDPTDPAAILCSYGDAYTVTVFTPGPLQIYLVGGCNSPLVVGARYTGSGSLIRVEPDALSTYSPCIDQNIPFCQTTGTVTTAPFFPICYPPGSNYTNATLMTGCFTNSYSALNREIVGRAKGIITENYDVTVQALTLNIGCPQGCI